MDSKKLEFATDVTRIIRYICKLVFNLESANEIQKVFGINEDELTNVINRIVDALPPSIFNLSASQMEEIKHIFAREFVFFQVQERGDDVKYEDDLSKFIAIFARDIQQRISAEQTVNRS